jgi:hypothetical protein
MWQSSSTSCTRSLSNFFLFFKQTSARVQPLQRSRHAQRAKLGSSSSQRYPPSTLVKPPSFVYLISISRTVTWALACTSALLTASILCPGSQSCECTLLTKRTRRRWCGCCANLSLLLVTVVHPLLAANPMVLAQLGCSFALIFFALVALTDA